MKAKKGKKAMKAAAKAMKPAAKAMKATKAKPIEVKDEKEIEMEEKVEPQHDKVEPQQGTENYLERLDALDKPSHNEYRRFRTAVSKAPPHVVEDRFSSNV